MRGPRPGVILKTTGATQWADKSSVREAVKKRVESQPVKWRLGGWCEMALTQAVVSWWLSSAQKAVKIETKRVKLKNLHC
jgi:hypothetical protein